MYNNNIAIERIDEAKKNQLRFLDLSFLHLDRIPADISDMNYLLDIDLSYNRFVEFPVVLSKLDNLQFLDISNNSLQNVHFELGKYYSFKEVNISNNLLNFIPDELFYLNGDVKIIFYNNPFLDGLPAEIENQEDLSFFSFYLESLRQRDNRQRLFEIKLLIVGKGNVGKTSLMKVLQNPTYKLKVGKEKTTPGINIENLHKPILFPAKKPYYNKYEDFENIYFQDSDEDFDYDENENTEERVRTLISYTPLSDHIALTYEDDDYLAELRISDEPYHTFSNVYFEKEVKINIWDFGGQEILYSTHQFFLTQRSLYLFVWEPRTDNEEENFDYWLNIIKRLSNNSPVLVVMNKAEIRIKSINELRYLKKFKNIVGFYNVSCLTKEGINDLINEIKNTITKLPQIGDILPTTWNNIRKKIKLKNKDYISYREFKDICNLSDIKKTEYLGAYLNDLGDIIHFKDDLGLKDFVIINPHWLTKAIYELINSLEIQKRNGLFDATDLSKYLDNIKYPEEKHYEILMLMEKFEICFKILGSKNLYIIPSLLQANPPDAKLIEDFKIPESLKFEIKYNFMPSGLIERLICRLNGYIEGNNFWKYGSVFNTEYNKALVTINKVENTINLFVLGEIKSDLYNIIIHELHQIHKDLKLKVSDYEEKFACNCIQCSTSSSFLIYHIK